MVFKHFKRRMEKEKIMSNLDVLGIVARAKNFVVLNGQGFDEVKRAQLKNDLEKLINTIMKLKEEKRIEKRMLDYIVSVIENTIDTEVVKPKKLKKVKAKILKFKKEAKNA